MITISELTPDDVVETAKLHAHTFSSIGQTESFAKVAFTASGQRTVIAKTIQSTEISGYAQTTQKGSTCYLNWIATTPKEKNKGIGNALLKDIKEWALSNACNEIALDSRNRFREALIFYIKNDFDVVGTYVESDGDIMV